MTSEWLFPWAAVVMLVLCTLWTLGAIQEQRAKRKRDAERRAKQAVSILAARGRMRWKRSVPRDDEHRGSRA